MRILLRPVVVVLLGAAAAACDGPQSALDPAGRDAAEIRQLFLTMSVGAILIWIAVVAIAVYAVRASPEVPRERAMAVLILGGGVAFPVVVLAALLAYGLPMLPRLLAPAPPGSPAIHVVGEQWWWRVRYAVGETTFETANEFYFPVNQRVELQLASTDVIHSFWVPPMAGKMDMIPGRLTRLAVEPTRTGVFLGACAEYCGASHAYMGLIATVVEPDAFLEWVRHQATPAAQPPTPAAVEGQTEFIASGCGACHTVRGTEADGRVGPDLTHVGSRRRLAAGLLENDFDAIRRWVADAQALKPGVHMPSFGALGDSSLDLLAVYLEGLQ